MTLASVAAAPRMVAVSSRSMSSVNTLPSAGRSIVMAATAPSRPKRMTFGIGVDSFQSILMGA